MGNENEDQTYVGEMSANEHHSTKGGSHFQYMKKGKREEEEEGGGRFKYSLFSTAVDTKAFISPAPSMAAAALASVPHASGLCSGFCLTIRS